MVIKNVNLETVCGITSTIPENDRFEVAFAGKSNVGKSSLINALMNRKALARTSAQPGKTQTINFYNINDAMYLVDLPGYGYANANIEIKAKWGKMIENYLHTSKKLNGVFLLIDIRHDPSENDQLMYEWMVSQGFAPIIIATKADKLKRSQLPAHLKAIEEVLNVEPGTIIIPFSAETKQGREEIWELIDSLVLVDEDGNPLSEEEIAAFGKRKKNTTNDGNPSSQENAASKKEKKPRWKAIGKETGKRKNSRKADSSKAHKKKK
ncbi:YihA family ribosome biogenesis GTP-binding protein [Roseburia sp. MUC/MUC-530-WT-4D]|uniref:Probable GTP-binding protein EngB n=1 Tax=Roseburia porci TaxID=2605790 RepID=A0A6L5YPK4_9FIRM|nr:YihA family ribosome biogenesis GTP-binding protein [Roseburia porci]